MTGAKRKAALKTLAESLEKDAPSSKDATRVKALAELVERIK
jgi:hypothetical protein